MLILILCAAIGGSRARADLPLRTRLKQLQTYMDSRSDEYQALRNADPKTTLPETCNGKSLKLKFLDQLVQVGERYLAVQNEQSGERTLAIFQGNTSTCQLILERRLPLPANKFDPKLMVAVDNDRLIFFSHGPKLEGSPKQSVHVLTIDNAGKTLSTDELTGKTFHYTWSTSRLSFRDGKVLIPMIDENDPTHAPCVSVYTKKGASKCVLPGSNFGIWTTDGRIVANAGKHANEGEIVVLGGKDFSAKKILLQPIGYKSNISIHGAFIEFLNQDTLGPAVRIRTPIDKKSGFEKIGGSSAVRALGPLPTATDVVYASEEGRKVPSILLMPSSLNGVCAKGGHLPVVVYLHGGNYSGLPTGHFRQSGADADPVLLAEMGFIVVDANYFGDQYTGLEFLPKKPRDPKAEAFDSKTMDVHAAGIFARSLPCADPKKIILMGHSYGAITAANYVTEEKYREITPYSGVVLRGGSYTFDTLRTMGKDGLRPFEFLDSTQNAATSDGSILAPPNCSVAGSSPQSNFESLQKICNNLLKTTHVVSFNQRVVPELRLENLHDVPIYVMHGADDTNAAKIFESQLKMKSSKIQSWYPQMGGHEFFGEVQLDMVDKIRDFIGSLP